MSGAIATAKASEALQTSEEVERMQTDAFAGPGIADEDLYTRLKSLQRQLEFLEIQVR
jgi:hypothetical protein